MITLSPIEKTMLFTLRPRAEEHARPDRLFTDPQAVAWFAQAEWPDKYEEAYSANMQTGIAIRVKTIDDIVERFTAAHPSPLIVELGAGLSTRASRLNLNPSRYVAVDLPAALAFRQTFATDEAPSQQIAGSILETDWFDHLPTADSESILFVAEGLLAFFKCEQIAAMVAQLNGRFAGATLVGNVIGEGNRSNAGKLLESMGASAQWYITDEQDLENLGLSLLNLWPLVTQYPQRWGRDMTPWTSDPVLRHNSVIFEAKL